MVLEISIIVYLLFAPDHHLLCHSVDFTIRPIIEHGVAEGKEHELWEYQASRYRTYQKINNKSRWNSSILDISPFLIFVLIFFRSIGCFTIFEYPGASDCYEPLVRQTVRLLEHSFAALDDSPRVQAQETKVHSCER